MCACVCVCVVFKGLFCQRADEEREEGGVVLLLVCVGGGGVEEEGRGETKSKTHTQRERQQCVYINDQRREEEIKSCEGGNEGDTQHITTHNNTKTTRRREVQQPSPCFSCLTALIINGPFESCLSLI